MESNHMLRSVMAFHLSVRLWILGFALLNITLFSKNIGIRADDDDVTGDAGEGGAGFGGAGVGAAGGGAGFGGGGGAGAGVDGGGAGFGGTVGVGGGGAGIGGAAGAGVADPGQIVSEALHCFNDKYIYSSCEESCRLNEKGYLNVPPEKTAEFCEGPCLSETNLVLNCIHNIFSRFLFVNKATVKDIEETMKAGCGYGPERGDFNVAKHIQSYEESSARKPIIQVVWVLGFIIMGRFLTFFTFA